MARIDVRAGSDAADSPVAQPLLLNRARAFEEFGIEMVGTPARSYLGLPILVGRRAIGVISVQSTQLARRFGEGDTRLLSTIAANVGMAIQNARLYRETGRRASEMAALAELGREVGAMLEIESVLRRVGERARELLEADTSAVFLEELDGKRFLPIVAFGEIAELIMADTIRPGEGITGDLASRAAADVLNDVLGDECAVEIPGEEVNPEERLMAAPLPARAAIKRTPAPRRSEGGRPGNGGRGVPVGWKVLARLAANRRRRPVRSELIQQFVADAPAILAAAREGVEAGDAEATRRAAHTLKSNATTFGAHRLADQCRDLEDAAKQGSLEDGPARLEELTRELETVREMLPAVWRKMSAKTST